MATAMIEMAPVRFTVADYKSDVKEAINQCPDKRFFGVFTENGAMAEYLTRILTLEPVQKVEERVQEVLGAASTLGKRIDKTCKAIKK
jgi:hypothetical protein